VVRHWHSLPREAVASRSLEVHRIHRIHRLLGVGRDLCGSSSPTTLLKQGHLEQAAQDLAKVLKTRLWQGKEVLKARLDGSLSNLV